MSSRPQIDARLRESILSDPEVLLEDHDLMRALVAANEQSMGANIVDLRGIAMERLEARLDRLEDTHRSVIAAAYENLAGMNQIHRAVLRLLDAGRLEDMLADLGGDVADILRVDAVTLVLESQDPAGAGAALERLGAVLHVAEPGFVSAYVTRGRRMPERAVTLRQIGPGEGPVHGARAADLRSEACIVLSLGAGRLPAMLCLGSEDPHLFSPQQGTDLLGFFGGVFERTLRRWLG